MFIQFQKKSTHLQFAAHVSKGFREEAKSVRVLVDLMRAVEYVFAHYI